MNKKDSISERKHRIILCVFLILAMICSSVIPQLKNLRYVSAEENQSVQNTDASCVLTGDNREQREEQEKENKQLSPLISATLIAQTKFDQGSQENISVIEDEQLDNLKQSLSLFLAKEQKEIVNIDLPLQIGFVNKNGEEQEKDEDVNVKLSLETVYNHLKTINNKRKLSLYHLKNTSDGKNEWEKIDFQMKDQDDNSYIEFTTNQFSPFLFVETKNTKTSKEKSVTQSTNNVENVIIDELNISFTDGATKTNSGWVWSPSSTNKGHLFTYQLDYSISGTYLDKPGALRIELPLHILKDRDGNWADSFECPYIAKSELSSGDEGVDFVYEIDEANNKIIITNNKILTSAQAGYIQFAYGTTKSTLDYKDMTESTNVPAKITAIGKDEKEVTKDVIGEPVSIDTNVQITSTQKKANPSYYTSWQSNWGTRPSDANEYYYLVWTIRSNISKATSPYSFMLYDYFSDLGGDVVGYRFSGQKEFTMNNQVDDQKDSGDRYDYVLTRYRKDQAEELLENKNTYDITNRITATVKPKDGLDQETSASSSQTWTYEKTKYTEPTGYFDVSKWGIYGQDNRVSSSEDISDYTLKEFVDNDKQSIDNLKYETILEGYPYPYTLEDGATGTKEDAENNKYGKKKVSYEFTDDTLYLEDKTNKLNDDDYDVTGIKWLPTMTTAVYDKDKMKFIEKKIETFNDEDAVTILVRVNSTWKKATVYDMKTGTYKDTDTSLVKATEGENISFISHVKGVRFTCSNAYYHTKLKVFPTISLKRTNHVIGIIGNISKLHLLNEVSGSMKQNDKVLYEKTKQATDYIQKVTSESEIEKDIIQTFNNKRKKQYVVTWRLNVQEKYSDNNGPHSIRQDSGTFYDLLPLGALLDQSSISIQASNESLTSGTYTVKTIENYKDSGRTMLIIHIKNPTTTVYQVTYKTCHSYDSIQDYGKNLLNSVAYETGNSKIADGYEDNGGKITDKDLMSNLDSSSKGDKFLYDEARHSISILMAGNNGLRKQVKSEKDTAYSSETYVNQGGNYSYQIRVANDMTTRCKNMIFFDSLENFYQRKDQTEEVIPSDWKGTLTGIDFSMLKSKEIQPVVYLSRIDKMNMGNHHDINEQENGEPIWVEYSEFVKKYGLSEAHAIAVDVSKKTDGTDFILEGKESLVFNIYMKAPITDTTNLTDPVTYNNVYMQRDIYQEDNNVLTQFIHQDYTKVHYRVTGNLAMKKVDKRDGVSPVSKATYLLRGTSDYGTVYETKQTTDRNGEFNFENIEKGKYEIVETSCSEDWLINQTVYTVEIDSNGNVTLGGSVQNSNGQYIVEDEPRIHGNIEITKVDSITKNPINDVEFLVTGTSDYGTDVSRHMTSSGEDKGKNPTGNIRIDNLELGTYKLTEVKTKEGYILSQTDWTIKVDDRGIVTLYNADGNEVTKDKDDVYQIENEPLHSIRFVKTSTYGKNITLQGAEFSLTGISDYGTNVNKTGESTAEGIVVIDGLEPGTYQLKETKAPENHELSTTTYTVNVKNDGSFTIDGLHKTYDLENIKLYEFKDVRTSGVVKLIKNWKDNKSNAERIVPNMTISTQLPSKDPRGYTLTFDANGGTFTNNIKTNGIVYSKDGVLLDGTYQLPTNNDGSFIGWYTQAKGGTEVELDKNNNPTTPIKKDTTIYAHYIPSMKYAVAIYDIGVDDMEGGAKGGLTFGPALGAEAETGYVQTYHSHIPSGTTASGHAHRCVHDDDWSTIIEWNHTDPYVYEQCIDEGCTHSVKLNKNTTSTILNANFDSSKETGDGPSVLYYELITETDKGKCYENLRYYPKNDEISSNSWGISRMRAMLNGADDLTDVTDKDYNYANDKEYRTSSDIHKEASIYTNENCLLATFPTELQNAIGKKTIKCEAYFGKNCENKALETTYDKLWLFSINELSPTVSDEKYNHPDEGNVYAKMKNAGDFPADSTMRKSVRMDSDPKYFTYQGIVLLRSQYTTNIVWVSSINYSGGTSYWSRANYTSDVAVGFTLSR
ncbi:MAG: SpaA isopeptide-forming pilin-related protein [Bacillota bacterium]|nr:SpaA isopeptide-forming pilin-related protein [Bacillota bacterium]